MASRKEKCYIFWIIFFILASIGLLAGLLYIINVPPKDKEPASVKEETCLTKDCTLTASLLIKAVDTSVDPCKNFYEFSCANFIRTNPVPVGKPSASAAWHFNKNFQLQLKNLVEGMGSVQGPNVMYRMQEAYHVCINTTYQEQKEMKAFKNFTKNTLDWPFAIGRHWQRRKPSLTDYVAMYEEKGLFNTIARIDIRLDPDNPKGYNVLIYDQYWRTSALLKPSNSNENPTESEEKQMEKEEQLKALEIKLLKDVAHLIGNQDDESIDQDVHKITEMANFIKSLKEESDEEEGDDDDDHDDHERTESSENATIPSGLIKTTFGELTQRTGQINWRIVVNKKMRGSHTFTDDDTVLTNNFDWFDTLKLITEKFPLRMLANLMGWEAIFPHMLKEAGHDLEEMMINFDKEKTEINGEDDDNDDDDDDDVEDDFAQSRWKKCLQSVHRGFMLVITRMFLEKYVERSEKKSADELIQLIQEAYKQTIRDSSWLDEETKQNALKKADAIKRYVGYPDFIFDDKALDEAYKDVLPVVKDTHFGNILAFVEAGSISSIPRHDQTDVGEWDMSPLIVNAFYKPNENSIWFPSAILQLPFFQDNRLAAVNFGMIGAIIGHEVGHAFDDDGSTYDENGEPKNWWSNETREIFEKKGKCFVEQYDNFCPEFLQGDSDENRTCVNGQRTLGENLADYTGIIASFKAYKLWVEKHGADKRLPGLEEFSPEQLFFISNAYVWCENVAPDKWLNRYRYDSHAPGRYRVLGTATNNPFFRETFNCPEGPMNRGEKSCTVW